MNHPLNNFGSYCTGTARCSSSSWETSAELELGTCSAQVDYHRYILAHLQERLHRYPVLSFAIDFNMMKVFLCRNSMNYSLLAELLKDNIFKTSPLPISICAMHWSPLVYGHRETSNNTQHESLLREGP